MKQPLHMFATAPLLRSVCACVRVRAGGSEGVCAPALEHEHEVAGGGAPLVAGAGAPRRRGLVITTDELEVSSVEMILLSTSRCTLPMSASA